MMTALEHSDKMLRLQQGRWVMVCDPVSAVDMAKSPLVAFSGAWMSKPAASASTERECKRLKRRAAHKGRGR